ncbi:hypothetical protein ACXWOF_09430, partial [Streptococcus pyogenes]
CPATWSVFETVQQAIEKKSDLHGRVRLVFLSLNPETDTPDLLSFYKGKSTAAVPWRFLTTWSEWFLEGITQRMNLTPAFEIDKEGRRTGQI